MLKTIFDTLLKVTDPRPKYTGSRCLVEKNAVGGCDKCMTACPHDAVRITDHIEILEGACTGCGLCVQVCPTGALEYDLLPMLGALKDQGVRVAESPEPVAVLTCSKVPGNAAHIECLGRVSPAMVLASSAWGQELQLIRSDCATCKIGGPTVPESLENVLEIARTYRKNLAGEPLNVSILEHQSGEPGQSALIPTPPPKPVSRRDAFKEIFQGGKRGLAQVVPENPIPGVVTTLEAPRIPDEWKWRKLTLKPRPLDETQQYWPVPSVNDDCIFCPVCENVCPTKAVTRTRDETGHYSIQLEVAACTGCDACVKSCPPSAMKLEPGVAFSQLTQIMLLHQGDGLEG
jgi:ferredoxin